jgi:hypothetical protein
METTNCACLDLQDLGGRFPRPSELRNMTENQRSEA